MLIDQLEEQGNWLFRRRSFLPFLIFPLIIYFFHKHIMHPYFKEIVEENMDYICVLISLCGAAIRAYTVGHTPKNTSGRNTTEQKADSLNTTGIYSVIRHPLYFANYLIFAGFILQIESVSLFVILTLIYFIYYERIMIAEESFLNVKFGGAYTEWAAKTPAFFPNPLLWKKPDLPFSLKYVLRREPPGLLLICLIFSLYNFIEDVIFEGDLPGYWVKHEPFWVGLFAFGLISYFALKIIRKKTNILTTDR
jgi:protein-S-isoprenylcysteine O-methyltransferase Ste14